MAKGAKMSNPNESEATTQAAFDAEFAEWLRKMEAQIESTRRSEILTARDYETRINAE